MSKQRYINTKLWSDNWVTNLDPVEKLLFLYLLTNERTNIAGVYELPIKLMAVETGIEKEMVDKILKRFEKDNKIIYKKGWIIIKNFTKHQDLNNEKIKKGVESIINDIPQYIKDTLSIPYTYPSNNLNYNSNSNSNSNSIENGAFSEKDRKELIYLFKEVNPSYEILFSRKNQTEALSRLVKKYGREKVEQVIRALPEIITRKYAPRVTTPIQLEQKLGELIAFYKQEQSKGEIKGKVWSVRV